MSSISVSMHSCYEYLKSPDSLSHFHGKIKSTFATPFSPQANLSSYCGELAKRIGLIALAIIAYPVLGAIYLASKIFCAQVTPSPSEQATPNGLPPMTDSPSIKSHNLEAVHPYTGDLTAEEKRLISVEETNVALTIYFQNAPDFNVTIRLQDLSASHAQVIVNAANTHLNGGGGIDGAIHRAAGASYKAAHQGLRLLPQYSSGYIEGHASMITSGDLKDTHKIDNVIVVAGPQGPTTSPKKEDQLYSCYYNSLLLAHTGDKESIAFPSISTGVFRFPKDRAAAISLKAVYDFTVNYPNTTLKQISIHFLPEQLESLNNYQVAASTT